MHSKKFVVAVSVIFALVLCAVTFVSLKHNSSIETYSARIAQESEQVYAEKSGTVTYIATENNSPVNM